MSTLPQSLAALAEGSSIAVTIADATVPDHPLVHVNAAFARLTGHRPADLVGRNCRLLQGPGTDPAVRRTIAAALADGEPVVATLRNYRRDGTPFDNLLIVRPIHDGLGQPRWLLGCQYRCQPRVDTAALRRHVDVENALVAGFRSTMRTAETVVTASRQLGAETLFALACWHLRRQHGSQAILRVGA